jgi:hypothetical protein
LNYAHPDSLKILKNSDAWEFYRINHKTFEGMTGTGAFHCWSRDAVRPGRRRDKVLPERRSIMLFLNMYSFKEGKREEIIKRRLEIGTGAPEGVKIIGEWTALDGSGGYLIFDTDTPDYSWTMKWNDLLDMEMIPILDTEKDVMGLLK